ncbi:MAG: YvcK family protein [Candidatus Omnitrophica bacterium]|nr:YvcK family protein [Candidatus Omnitrophota bacterium]MBI5143848.1 YvcK family protein [Candidatus Omnitrophota bacterium]
MWVKRWILLTVFGIIMISMGFVMVILEQNPGNKTYAGVIIITGILSVITGVKRIIKSFVTILLPQREDELVDKVYQKRILDRGPKIVVIGGGTGLSTLLHGLKEYTSNITAIVTVADDGGSSGRLRQDFDILPPGDIRNCLVALADAEPLMGRLFQFRFGEGTEFSGHSFGNLFITAMSKVTGDFDAAIKESSKVLAIRGRVVPSTLDKITLMAEHIDGSETVGESQIPKAASPVKRIHLRPVNCKPTDEALDAIKRADAIILGPGSLYTSIMPNLLIGKIYQELISSKAIKIYVCNVMTQKGETDDYKASDHLKAIITHTAPGIVEYCIVNTAKIPDEMLKKYKEEESYPVIPDSENIRKMKYKAIEAHIISTEDYVRHDAVKLARIIIDLVTSLKRSR